MFPIILCSIAAIAIIGERIWFLQKKKVAPKHLVAQIWHWHKNNELTLENIKYLQASTPLGRVLASGLVNRHHSRDIMKEAIEDTGRHVAQDLEKFLNSLGTVAAVTPLLGLLGTVIGMIKVFAAITSQGIGDPAVLAGGISEALITTASGLSVAIPALMFHRFFRGRVDELVIDMEKEALKMVEIMAGDREKGNLQVTAANPTKPSRAANK
ncbi:MAG: MotA/TolQ/ExbB proton channel family protein [Gammaproteobacteria bacterium]|nr:MotA/TolQ/ExbB proton channel family protein [Gammaproteobacteria bacterium]